MRFPLFLAAALVSFAGDWLTTLAVGVLIYEITGSTAAPAAFILVRSLPRLAGPFAGGTLADHLPASRALAAVFLGQAAVTVGLYEAASHRSATGLLVAVAVSQLVGSSARPMLQAILPDLVDAETVPAASALFGTGYAVVILIAPAIGVGLLRASGAELLIGIDVASFVVAAALLLALGPVGQAGPGLRGLRPAVVVEGLPPMLGDPLLRTITGTQFSIALVSGVVQAAVVVIAADRFGSADITGFLYAALGIGGLLGGLLVTFRIPAKLGRDLVFAAGTLAMVPLAGLVATRSLWQALLLMGISAFGSIANDAWGPAQVAHRIDRSLLGRANAVLVMANFTGTLLGAAVGVVLIPLAGWPATVLGTGIAAITFAFAVAITGERGSTQPVTPAKEPGHGAAAGH